MAAGTTSSTICILRSGYVQSSNLQNRCADQATCNAHIAQAMTERILSWMLHASCWHFMHVCMSAGWNAQHVEGLTGAEAGSVAHCLIPGLPSCLNGEAA
eukprot:364021-Chlamydomonas_euryale.AAC.4